MVGVADRIDVRRWIDSRRLLWLFATVSTLYGFWVVYSMDVYLPWKVRLVKGVMWTTLGHFGLWLALFDWRDRVRYVVVAFLLLSMVGTLVLWWVAGIPALTLMGWRFSQLIRGAPNDAQSI